MTNQDSRYIGFIQDVLISIHENLRDLDGRRGFAAPEELPHIEAKILAYQEILAILKISAETCGLAKDEIGL